MKKKGNKKVHTPRYIVILKNAALLFIRQRAQMYIFDLQMPTLA